MLNVKNAFNIVEWNIVVQELEKIEVKDYLLQIIMNNLKDRWVIGQMEGEEVRYLMSYEVPQGSVLGPLL